MERVLAALDELRRRHSELLQVEKDLQSAIVAGDVESIRILKEEMHRLQSWSDAAFAVLRDEFDRVALRGQASNDAESH